MAEFSRGGDGVLHQLSADAERAQFGIDRERAEHQRFAAAGRDVPEPHRADQPAVPDGGEGEAGGGQPSVADALAGAREAVEAIATLVGNKFDEE
mgnify:CR=1 FL=1